MELEKAVAIMADVATWMGYHLQQNKNTARIQVKHYLLTELVNAREKVMARNIRLSKRGQNSLMIPVPKEEHISAYHLASTFQELPLDRTLHLLGINGVNVIIDRPNKAEIIEDPNQLRIDEPPALIVIRKSL